MNTHTRRIRPVAGGVSAIATFAVLALAACSSGSSKPQAQVPVLPTSASANSPASAGTAGTTGATEATGAAGASGTATSARPRITLDMTNAQLDALYNKYNQCLAANGFVKGQFPGQAAITKAENACVSQNPLPPWQTDASNPKAGDFVHAVVQCLRDKGVQYVDAGSPQGGAYVWSFGGPNNDSQSITLGLKYTPDCEKQVAAQGIGS